MKIIYLYNTYNNCIFKIIKVKENSPLYFYTIDLLADILPNDDIGWSHTTLEGLKQLLHSGEYSQYSDLEEVNLINMED